MNLQIKQTEDLDNCFDLLFEFDKKVYKKAINEDNFREFSKFKIECSNFHKFAFVFK